VVRAPLRRALPRPCAVRVNYNREAADGVVGPIERAAGRVIAMAADIALEVSVVRWRARKGSPSLASGFRYCRNDGGVEPGDVIPAGNVGIQNTGK
jgi:hypothetical protein